MEMTVFGSTTFVSCHCPQIKALWTFPQTSLWTALGPPIDVIILHFGETVEIFCQNLSIFF